MAATLCLASASLKHILGYPEKSFTPKISNAFRPSDSPSKMPTEGGVKSTVMSGRLKIQISRLFPPAGKIFEARKSFSFWKVKKSVRFEFFFNFFRIAGYI